MRILLAALNARYSHSCLALYALQASLARQGMPAEVREFTINNRPAEVARDIYRCQPQLAAFSCYIWNREETLRLCATLKKVMPGLVIVLGGPEVTFNGPDLLRRENAVDFVIAGEGELSFPGLVETLLSGNDLAAVPGLAWRDSAGPRQNPVPPLIQDLDQLPFPYAGVSLGEFSNRIIYYETSRGCPFQCAYCLSSRREGMRWFSLERVFSDLRQLIASGVRQVKFVDRTFNCHPVRTRAILSFLLELAPPDMNFHLEIAADLLDGETIALLKQAPAGLFQLEIGVQSTNAQVLQLIRRQMDFSRLAAVVRELQEEQNLHLHLDLIAGLPEEDLASLGRSFDDVFLLHPHQLQLGFLKLLPGTLLADRAEAWGMVFQDHPPREILRTRALSYPQLLEVQAVEETLEHFFNSGRFRQTCWLAASRNREGPFNWFLDFSRCWQPSAGEEAGAAALYRFLAGRCPAGDFPFWEDLLKLDLLLSGRSGKFLRHLKEGRGEGPDHLPAGVPRPKGMTVGQMGKILFREQFGHTFHFAAGMVREGRPVPSTLLFDWRSRHPVSGYPAVAEVE